MAVVIWIIPLLVCIFAESKGSYINSGTYTELPTFKLLSTRSGVIDPKSDIPDIEVTFANGLRKKINLSHYNALPYSETMDHSKLCNYLGHLEGEENESTVAVTGCLVGENPAEKTYITLLSKHTPFHKTFSLTSDGTSEYIAIRSDGDLIEEPIDIDRADDDEGWHMVNAEEDVNDSMESAAEAVTQEEESTVPTRLKINYRMGYDKNVKEYLTSRNTVVDNWLAEMMTHAQAHWKDPTLKHELIFENTHPTIFLDTELVCSGSLGSTVAKVKELNEPDVDLYMWINNKGGCTGVAYRGGACGTHRTSLTRGPGRGNAIVETAETLVHEVGHNLGMSHDFVGSPYVNCRRESDSSQLPCTQCHNYQAGNGGQPIGTLSGHADDCCNGFLGYYNHPELWSACSVRFFRDYYVARNWAQCFETLSTSPNSTTTPTPNTNTVTLNMKLTTKRWGDEISWTFGTCSSKQKYGSRNSYAEECKVAPGTYTLTCKDSYGDGWNGGYIEIQGKKYCDDFKCPSSGPTYCRTQKQKTVQVTVTVSA